MEIVTFGHAGNLLFDFGEATVADERLASAPVKRAECFMKFASMAKRVVLFLVVNFLVLLTIGIICQIFHVPQRIGSSHYFGLLVFCTLFGMGGSFVSLAISRWMAKVSMGVQVINPATSSAEERELVDMVYRLARKAGLPAMPEVGIYDSPEVNAFATGPSQSQALVAVSSGLLNQMRSSDVEAVLGHEIAHVANGDMVTMALLQGVVNALAMFFSWVLAIALSQGSSRDDDRGGNYFMQNMLAYMFQFIFGILGYIVVAWFSRWREFRADAGGARYAGRDHMISALKALEVVHEQGADMVGAQHPSFQALKISGGIGSLFADHPPLEERIARLERLPATT